MSSVSDNQSNWEQPIRSPSVSDEILYELGYSISPSTEEDEAGDHLTTEATDQTKSNKGLIINDSTCITRLDVKHTKESDSNSRLRSAEANKQKEYEEIDFQIGIESAGTTYPGHKLKDKKYLRKIKKRKRRKKGTTCSPTKLEAICREMSGLVVSEDDVSATETSPESDQIDEGLLRKQQSDERSPKTPNPERLTTKQGRDKSMDGKPEEIEQDKSKKIDGETNDREQNLSSDCSAVRSVNACTENSYLDKSLVVVEEHVPSENGNSNISNNCTSDDIQSTFPVCLKLVQDNDENRDSGDLQETVNLNDDEIIQIPGKEKDTENESAFLGNEDVLSSASREDKENSIESSRNLSETITSVDKDNSDKNTEKRNKFQGKDDILSSASRDDEEDQIENSRNLLETSVDKNESACKELNYEDLFGNIKQCSIKVRRLSEESIAVYSGGLTPQKMAAKQSSEMIHTSGLSCSRDELASSLESPQLDQENTEKVSEEILNDKQKPSGSSPEKFGSMIIMKALSVRVRRLSGDTIASYTSGAISPQKAQSEKSDSFKSPTSPLKSKSIKKRSMRQSSNSEYSSISSEPKVNNFVKKTAKCAKFSAINQLQLREKDNECSRPLRSRGEGRLKESPVKQRTLRTQMHETVSEVNFRHKSNPRNARIKVDKVGSGDKSLYSQVLEKVHGICTSNLSTQLKQCTISLQKIDCDESFTKVIENQRLDSGKKISGSDIFKIPLAPKLYQDMQRSGRNSRRNASSSSAGRPRREAKQSLETMSEVNTRDKSVSFHSWQEKFMKSMNKPLCSSSSSEKVRKDACYSSESKRESLREMKLNGGCHENVSLEIAGHKTERKKKRNGSSCHEALKSSQSSPIKLCSVRVRRLSGDTIASYINKMPGMFDNIVKNLTRRSEQNSVLKTENQRREELNSVSDFRVPSLPPRKRRKSGDSLSSLSKWSTRRQTLKTTRTNSRKSQKRKWIDQGSEDSESSVRPCSVKLSRLDPDSVSHCGHNWMHSGVANMPNQIHNPALNVSNLDKVVDDELYCLRRFLQVPPLAESKVAGNTSKVAEKQELPKLKACSVILKRITRKQNLEPVNIKKVIAKQLADNVEFSSGSGSDHEVEEESMNINKLLFALKDPANGREDGVSKEVQKDMASTEKPEDQNSETSTNTEEVDMSKNEGENTSKGCATPETDEVLQKIHSPCSGKGNGEQDKENAPDEGGSSEGCRSDPDVGLNSFFVTENTNEEWVQHGCETEPHAVSGDQNTSAETSGEEQKAMNEVTQNLLLLENKHESRKPESDIWSDNLPDIELDESSAMEETQQNTSSKDYLKSLSCVSVYSDTNTSSHHEDGERTSKTRTELYKDYFQISNTTKSCSVKLQRIDVRLNL